MLAATSKMCIFILTLSMAVTIYLYIMVKNDPIFSQALYMIQNETDIENNNYLNELKHYNDRMKTIKERFEYRNKLLKKGCHSLDKSLKYSSRSRTLEQYLHLSKDFNLLVCVVDKAGSNTWKEHLQNLNNIYGVKKGTYPYEYKTRASSLMPVPVLKDRMIENDFIRVMNTRHPLLRLVSSYIDKLENVKEQHMMPRIKTLIDEFRPERQGYVNFTFSEYLQLVVDDQKMNGDLVNTHWKTCHQSCSPCSLPYDYIMQVETHTEDLEYIFKVAGINDANVGLKLHASKKISTKVDPNAKYLSYYSNVNEDLLRKIYNIHKVDFQLFGYEIPQFLKNAIHNKI